MRRRPAALLLVLLASVAAMVAGATPAGAHPLGNFTVNRYARVEISAGLVRVYYVLDEAEIPTFQDRAALAAGEAAFTESRLAEIVRGLRLVVDGTERPLTVVDAHLSLPKGQGGLDTLRLAAVLEAPMDGDPQAVRSATFADTNEPGRVGWREIVVVAADGAAVSDSTAPAVDLSDELRSYPGDLLQAPLDLRQVRFGFVTGSTVAAAKTLTAPAATLARSGDGFTALLDRTNVTPVALAGMLLVAVGFGAAHALAPGHGKTVMAAYLVGTRGRPVDAVLLGVIVSAMHTGSVLLLGLVLYRIQRDVRLDRLYPVLTLASGLVVVGVGVWLLWVRGARYRAGGRTVAPTSLTHDHVHADEPATVVPAAAVATAPGSVAVAQRTPALVDDATGHDHDHDHDHGDAHHHDHGDAHHHDHAEDAGGWHDHGAGRHSHALPEGVAPLSRRGLVVLAASGGLLPSPSAVIVLVAAFAAGRVALGLALVTAFSVGLAVTLTAVGLALVFGSRAFGGHVNPKALRLAPVLGAAALVVVGLFVVSQGLAEL